MGARSCGDCSGIWPQECSRRTPCAVTGAVLVCTPIRAAASVGDSATARGACLLPCTVAAETFRTHRILEPQPLIFVPIRHYCAT